MLFKNKFYFYWIIILGQLLLSCGQKEAIESGPIIISEKFSSEKINAKVLIGNSFKQDDLKRTQIQRFIDSTFITNTSTASVLLGNSYQNNHLWVAFKIVNNSPKKEKLVVETVHIRCDGLVGYILLNETLHSLGYITRKTPLAERPYPFREFALPINISPKDTAHILLRSDRFAGFNELNLTLSKEKVFIENTISTNFYQLFQVFFSGALLLLIIVVSIMFSQIKLLYSASYIVVMAFLYCSYFYLTDQWSFPTFFKLNENNLTQFLGLTSIIIFQIFAYQLFENFIFRKKIYLTFIFVLSALVIFVLIGILFTNEINKISAYAIGILANISSIWIFCYAILGLFRAKEKLYSLLIFILFLPTILFFIISIFSKIVIVDLNYFNYLLSLIVVSVFVLSEFKKDLVSKQNADKKLMLLNQSLEEIRKTEVENIGRNLHDQVGNTLASALGYLNMKNPKIEIVKNIVFDSINEIRFLSHNLVKNEDKPLTEKLEELVARFNDFSKIQFNYLDFSNGNINKLEPLKLQNIYMIVQELFNNIIKHSSANEAFIQIFEQEKMFQFNIEDDGIGIKGYAENKGIGLSNIHKRAELSNLKLIIESTSEGTNTIIEILKK